MQSERPAVPFVENLCTRTAKLRSGWLTGRRECDKLPENFGSFVEGFAQNGRKRQKTLTRGGSLCYHSGQWMVVVQRQTKVPPSSVFFCAAKVPKDFTPQHKWGENQKCLRLCLKKSSLLSLWPLSWSMEWSSTMSPSPPAAWPTPPSAWPCMRCPLWCRWPSCWSSSWWKSWRLRWPSPSYAPPTGRSSSPMPSLWWSSASCALSWALWQRCCSRSPASVRGCIRSAAISRWLCAGRCSTAARCPASSSVLSSAAVSRTPGEPVSYIINR